MMWSITFFFISVVSFKSSLFFSCVTDLSSGSLFMVSLVPLNFFMLNILSFFTDFLKNYLTSIILFLLVLVPVSVSFFSISPTWFLILLELSVFPTSLAILKFSKDSDKLISVFIMLSINLLGSMPFMIFMIWADNFFFSGMELNITSNFSIMVFLSFLLVLVCKLPLAMFHFWLTKAHVAASACISMFLASVLLKLGSFGLYKFSSMFRVILPKFSSYVFPWCIFFSMIFCMFMIRFVDMKMLVALSSVLHMSMMVPLICLGESAGVFSMLLMMLGHGLVSYFFFMLVSIMYENSMSRSSQYNKGSESSYGSFYLILFMLAFLNMGVPPFINFISEIKICLSLIMFSFYGIMIFSLSMILSIFFCMFLISKSIFSRKTDYTRQTMELILFPSFLLLVLLLLIFPLFF